MALTEFRHPYEILIRFKNGVACGIQLISETGVEKDGQVIQRTETPAEAQDIEGFALSDLIGETASTALLEVERLKAVIAAREEEVEQLNERLVGMIEANGGEVI